MSTSSFFIYAKEQVQMVIGCLFLIFFCQFRTDMAPKRNPGFTWWRRLNLPGETKLKIEPMFAFSDLLAHGGLLSSAAVNIPFILKFDHLGWPTVFNLMKNSIYPGPGIEIFKRGKRRRRRDQNCSPQPDHPPVNNNGSSMVVDCSRKIKLDQNPINIYHHPGGERASLFKVMIGTLQSLGISSGKACVLRAICEVHEEPLTHYGLFGEILTLLFTVSKSQFAKTKHLEEYLQAERRGQLKRCEKYQVACKTSIFRWHKYPHSQV